MACQYISNSLSSAPFSFPLGIKYKQSLWSENISRCSTYCMFVGIYQDEAVEQSKERIQVSQWDWHCDSNETSVVAPGPVLWSLETSTYSTHGNPAQTLWQNTTHCTTVQFLHQYCWGLGCSILMLHISCCCLYTSMTTCLIYSAMLNKSVLSSENKAVYGMVEKSCHNHSGLLLYVALEREGNASTLI